MRERRRPRKQAACEKEAGEKTQEEGNKVEGREISCGDGVVVLEAKGRAETLEAQKKTGT